MRRHWHMAGALVGGLLWMSGGCSSATSLSEDFGESTATAVRVQRLRAQPVEPRGVIPVLEGQPADRVMQRYIRSFDRSATAAPSGMPAPASGGLGSMELGQ